MALKTKIIVQQILNIDDTTTTTSKYPKYTVVLGNSISSITAGELTTAVEASAASAALATQKATTAMEQATSAAGSATTASEKATNATSAADRAETAAASAAQVMQASLRKDQSLKDLIDKSAARATLNVQGVKCISSTAPIDFNALASPDGKLNLLIANNGTWGVQSVGGVIKPLVIERGGTGATNVSQARNNLGIGETAIPVFGGIAIDAKNSTASGILYLRNKNPESVQISYSRIYNEIQGGVAKATIQVTREGGDTNYYQFDEAGNALNYNTITIGRGIGNALGSNSLVIGDTDTGFKWGGDGIIQIHCNSRNIASFDAKNMHLNGLLNIRPVDNNAFGIRVSGARTGVGNALIGGQIAGGGWDGWRDRATGILIEVPNPDVAVSIFKAVQWGAGWLTGFDVARYASGTTESKLFVRGAEFTFHDSGIAFAANWISTSDIRLKTQLKEIKTAREKVKAIKGYTYFKRNNIDEDEHSFYSEEAGVIAQDVQTVLPEAVYKISNSEYLGVSYSGVTALLVNAFNELNEVVEKQQQEIDELKELVKQLLDK